MKKQNIYEHLRELKQRLLIVVIAFLLSFVICYIYSQELYRLLLNPLQQVLPNLANSRMIYTGLTEVFCSYLKLAAFASFMIVLPIFAIQVYLFLSPGLYYQEKVIVAFCLLLSPILFWVGSLLAFHYIMPKAWQFFISFQNTSNPMPIILEAKVNEYLALVIDLTLAFGIAFQLPILLVILYLLNIITIENLQQKRKLAIVINFIIAGVITPPDVLSQIGLALPMIILYEISIIICKFIQNQRKKC